MKTVRKILLTAQPFIFRVGISTLSAVGQMRIRLPEIIEGQRQVGILDMQIYRKDRSLFMIKDTVDDFDFAREMARLATLPRQAEWESYVSQFQGCSSDARSDEKWQRMERIF